jgi:uncharacterized protein (DUF58 family)
MLRRHFGFVPTRRLAALVLLLAPAWLLSGAAWGFALAVAATAALVVAALSDAVRAPGTDGLTVARELPTDVGLGDAVEGSYHVRSAWPRPVRVALFDALPRGVEALGPDGAPAPVGVARAEGVVPAAGELAVPLVVAGRARGAHPLGPLALRAVGPLGLLQRTLRYAPDDAITVAPSLAGVRRFRLLALQHRLREVGVRATRRRGEGTTFSSLREYVVGDDPRHIDWKATARRRKPITREYTVEQGQTVVIAVDAGRLMTQLAGALPRFEYALSSALVLADVAVHSGDRVGLLLFDDEVRAFVPPDKGTAALRQLRAALIPAQATMAEPDYAAAFRTLATRHRRRSLIVLFTDVVDARSSQALVALTSRSASRHLPVVVALRNDALLSAALPAGRRAPGALYASAAAEELLSARDEALARMRQAGVGVLDVSPQAMTAAVVNRYLEIKARGAL